MEEDRGRARAVFDTNLFVAAGFNPRSSSAELLRRAGRGEIEAVWSEATRRETEHVLRRIPRLRWEDAEGLFRPALRHDGEPDPAAFAFIEDRDDRKFAALAAATGATLVTSDDDLLKHAARADMNVATPSAFLRRLDGRQ